ncbi:MAG: acyl-CoA desaturase [bacterium]|nr:acyl-CoA desaturase [bacterium]
MKYARDPGLHAELRSRVDAYLQDRGEDREGGWRMVAKTAVILGWLVGTYVAMFAATAAWQLLVLAISMGLALACVGFSIQHDGGHRAYSKRPWVSRLAAFSLDAIGASSYMWHYKHNVLHHTYPNVEQVDDDISQSPWLRLSTTDAHYSAHRFQHMYAWFLYAILTPKWLFVDDFKRMVTQRAGARRVPPPRGRDLAMLLLGKALAYTWMFVIPLIVVGPSWGLLGIYVLVAWVWGLTLATTFQLAHCNDNAEFGAWPSQGEQFSNSWAEQQLASTVNFAPRNRVLTWYLGGLNHQIEHHLFPRVCHIHYPAISSIVREVCERRGLRYRVQASMWSALRSHVAHLRRVGASA